MITHVTLNEHYGVRLGFYSSRNEALRSLVNHFHEEVGRLDPRPDESEDALEERVGEFYHAIDEQDYESAWKWLGETFDEAAGTGIFDLSVLESGHVETRRRRLH